MERKTLQLKLQLCNNTDIYTNIFGAVKVVAHSLLEFFSFAQSHSNYLTGHQEGNTINLNVFKTIHFWNLLSGNSLISTMTNVLPE